MTDSRMQKCLLNQHGSQSWVIGHAGNGVICMMSHTGCGSQKILAASARSGSYPRGFCQGLGYGMHGGLSWRNGAKLTYRKQFEKNYSEIRVCVCMCKGCK